DPGPIMPRQVDLLKTFADQAVIAIENTRLFEAEQASKRELQESLEYQTATGEVLGVISRSPTDVQPVFNTIARRAAELCKAQFSHVFGFDGVLIHCGPSHALSPIGAEAMRTKSPIPPGRASAAARTILPATVEEIPDVDADPDFEHGDVARLMNYRSIVAVPMTKEGHPIGAIVLVKSQAGRFPDRQIDLLKTFADQAVIAIENARLFEEVQARNRELRATLEQQTATSEILGVISRSPTDVQPIFDAIAESSVRLCGANVSSVVRLVGDVRHRVAQHGMPPQFAEESSRLFPPSLTRDLIGDVAMLDRKIVHVEDIQNDARYPASQALARIMGYRAALSVPMLRDSGPVGAISVFRQDARRFTEAEIALLRTFADQAVIAIENSRLFEEVQARNRDLTALGEVGRAVSSTLDLKVVLKTIVDRAVHLTGTDAGSIFYYREETGKFELGETTGLDEQVVARLRKLDISLKESGLAEAIAG